MAEEAAEEVAVQQTDEYTRGAACSTLACQSSAWAAAAVEAEAEVLGTNKQPKAAAAQLRAEKSTQRRTATRTK